MRHLWDVLFPQETAFCNNPSCDAEAFEDVELSRRGRVWSYTDAQYQPPPPYIPRTDPYQPFALAAVELEGLVVMGQVADGFGVGDLSVGAEVELVVEPLTPTSPETGIWRWKPVPRWREAVSHRRSRHAPVGQVGQPFVQYGAHAAREALADAGIAWNDVDLVVGGETVRNGYAGYVAGSTFAQALGWNGARVATSYAACATGAQALDTARARILAGMSEVALVVGADTTPKGFLAPNAGERWDDPDWLRFRLLGMTNPAYFALYARRRIDLYGATVEDFAAVKVKNARHGLANPNARYRKETPSRRSSPRQWSPTPCTCWTSAPPPTVGQPWCWSVTSRASTGSPTRSASPRSPRSRRRSRRRCSTCPTSRPSRPPRSPPGERTFKESIAHAAYEEAGIAPDDVDVAEVYDLSTALELDWIEDIGLCKRGEAEALLRAGDTSIGGRIPVNPSGGLACFGEAVPAQALAQVCELTWQLRGQAEGRQVEGAAVGITANQGLFGHGSAVLLVR